MIGKQLQKNVSELSLSGRIPLVLEYLLLFGIGILAIMLHARLRTPLNIPGHHGIEFMALIMAGRVASNIKWASSISSLGVGMVLLFPVFGFSDPFMGFVYMLPGITVDIFYNLTWRSKYHLIVLALISGLAYYTIPFGRLFINVVTGFQYFSFIKHGYFIPLLSFFIFGSIGGFAGAGITSSLLKYFSKK